jgi:hypothetical protein
MAKSVSYFESVAIFMITWNMSEIFWIFNRDERYIVSDNLKEAPSLEYMKGFITKGYDVYIVGVQVYRQSYGSIVNMMSLRIAIIQCQIIAAWKLLISIAFI